MPAGRKAVLVSLGSAALLTGCASTASGGSSPPASPTGAAPLPSATASAALPCKHITSLRTSLAGLAQMTGRAVSPRQIAPESVIVYLKRAVRNPALAAMSVPIFLLTRHTFRADG